MLNWASSAIDALGNAVFFEVEILGAQVGLIVIWLALPMLFFTFYLGFVNLRGFTHGLATVRGRLAPSDGSGEMTQFQALSTALSGTVGLGNIAGVAVALAMGGPGAIFWMFVIGWFAMTLKFSEVTLGMKYREEMPDGTVRGGPMYTLKNGLAARGHPRLGKWAGGIYAFFAIFAALPMFQVNQSFSQAGNVFGLGDDTGTALLYGLVLSFFTALVIFGGARWLGRVTAAIVPTMGSIYLLGILIILIVGFDEIPAALAAIVGDAFTGEAAAGGAIGAFVVGMRRAVFSTEAGTGSSVMAHVHARTREPVSEGMVALLEPFIDTVVICSLGGLALVVAGTWVDPALDDIGITSQAFANVAWWMPYLLAAAVILFAYSTICAWGFYGAQAWGYLFGGSRAALMTYKLLFIALLPAGAIFSLDIVISFVDSAFFLMAVPNVIALYLFAPELKAMLADYRARKMAPGNRE
ncbi:alanine/glycine:cation symporter family protein [Sphingomicrobium lutaoense]|uniref:AGCS family alanine or glycine:cation symporter n=1 Tax=Sphingomicrobium lutaoense TaxID=515949 RepID=A0A839Z1L1_9SPHN|nr:amino acid carrier protein [Sphingomicrobium lutaoense]MBB3763475.1 AGCS family alanine or glycine:cation symporter [Sphingomicrobium lutaoense]